MVVARAWTGKNFLLNYKVKVRNFLNKKFENWKISGLVKKIDIVFLLQSLKSEQSTPTSANFTKFWLWQQTLMRF